METATSPQRAASVVLLIFKFASNPALRESNWLLASRYNYMTVAEQNPTQSL